jgi:hypothetical protein
MTVILMVLTVVLTQVSDMLDPPLITSHSYGDTEQGRLIPAPTEMQLFAVPFRQIV